MRFSTGHFHRSGPWYYEFYVLAVGFLPGTLMLPYRRGAADAPTRAWAQGQLSVGNE